MKKDHKTVLTEVDALKRSTKYTKIKELELQLQCFTVETEKITKLAQQVEQLRIQELGKFEKVSSFQKQYYMNSNVIDGLKRDE